MKCFNHSEIDAVGVCKSCGKALCHDCIAEVGSSCSCKGQCELGVTDLNAITKRHKAVPQKDSAIRRRRGILLLLWGILLTGCGVAELASGNSNQGAALLFFGLIILGAGLVDLVAAHRLLRQ